jgi:hypothetical protein
MSTCDKEIMALINKEAIKEGGGWPGPAICKQVYCKNKSFGGYRPIINLKRVNLADVEPKHFKMKG